MGPEANVKTVDSRSKGRNRNFFFVTDQVFSQGAHWRFLLLWHLKKQGCGILHRKNEMFDDDIVSLERLSVAILAANWGRRVWQGRSYDLAINGDHTHTRTFR